MFACKPSCNMRALLWACPWGAAGRGPPPRPPPPERTAARPEWTYFREVQIAETAKLLPRSFEMASAFRVPLFKARPTSSTATATASGTARQGRQTAAAGAEAGAETARPSAPVAPQQPAKAFQDSAAMLTLYDHRRKRAADPAVDVPRDRPRRRSARATASELRYTCSRSTPYH